MRTVGIDIASSSYGAIALVVDEVPQRAVLWTPKDNKDSDAEKIYDVYKWTCWQLGLMKPDIVSVERQAGYVRNHDVVRSLSKREGAALVAAKQQRRAVVINPPVTQSRGVVFRQGNISKDDAWEVIKKMYPNFDFGRKTTGGTDRADALVNALAAPTILERRK
jgi:hypothetical protein